jgi:hypothetical protein
VVSRHARFLQQLTAGRTGKQFERLENRLLENALLDHGFLQKQEYHMTKPHHSDIVICGAGIAGVATAYQLAVVHGVKNVVIVDPLPPLTLTSDKSRNVIAIGGRVRATIWCGS